MRRMIVLLLILTLAGVVAVAYWRGSRGAVEVEAAEVTRRSVTVSFSADGVVKGKTVDVAPRISARVMAILVAEGVPVQRGAVLLRLDDRALQAAVREAEAGARVAGALLAQAETALALARQQTTARQEQAAAQLEAAQARLRQLLSGPRLEEIAQAQARVSHARAVLEAAQHDVRRARELYSQGAISRAELDAAEAAHQAAAAEHRVAAEAQRLVAAGAHPEEIQAARAQVGMARAELDAARGARREVSLREAEVQAARSRLEQAEAALDAVRTQRSAAVLEAPFDGVVARVIVEVGELVMPGQPVLTIVDARRLWIDADLADEDAAKVRPGQEVTITVPAYPGRRFRGRVESLAPQAELKPDAALRTRIVRMKVAPLEGVPLLMPGMEVDVEGEGTITRSALVMPSDALLIRENRNTVFVVQNGVARLREVRIGFTTFAVTEVLAGLHEGELVVVRGKDQLRDGRRVRVVRSGS